MSGVGVVIDIGGATGGGKVRKSNLELFQAGREAAFLPRIWEFFLADRGTALWRMRKMLSESVWLHPLAV